MRIVCVIPARMGSSRFPGKPLALIMGRPMIEHVYRRAALCAALDGVYVATCDQEIRRAAEGFGAPVIMTSARQERASERVAEAARGLDADIVVMVQGDEPMLTPAMIDEAVAPLLEDESVACSNLIHRIETSEEFEDPNTIKVVQSGCGDALYFSRQPIPTTRVLGFEQAPRYKQVCVIPFRREFLLDFAQLAPTPLERIESIDMLRVLEHGHAVRLIETSAATWSVDTPADLARVEWLMRGDPLLEQYGPQPAGERP